MNKLKRALMSTLAALALTLGIATVDGAPVLACDPETQNCVSTWTEEEHRDAFNDHSDQGFESGPGPNEDQPIAN